MTQSGKSWHRWVIFCGLIGVLIYAIVIPVVWQFWPWNPNQPAIIELTPATFLEKINQRLIEFFFAFLFFFTGATVGSFLNVVAYRMPRGQSVVFQPSRCPSCDRRLSPRENIPVFGWLLLNGKCRFCGIAISPRYPIVEAITGIVFLILYFVQLISGGANLPNWTVYPYKGVIWILLYTKWDMLALYFYHSMLFTWLIIFALFAWDRQPVPRRSLIIGTMILLIPQLLLPYLNLYTFRFGLNETFNIAATAAIGGTTGWFAAVLLKLVTRKSDWKKSLYLQEPISAALMFTGLTLGVRALAGILLMLVIWRSFCWVTRLQFFWHSIPLVGWWAILALIHHSYWRQIVGQ